MSVHMRVLGILGSPKKGGNTDKLLDEALHGALESEAEVEKISIGDYDIAPCEACDDCLETGRCSIQDDMQPIYEMLLSYDGVILASPIYFYGLTAQTKALVDRCQSLWHRKYSLKETPRTKQGLFISVAGGQGEKLFDGARLTVKYFFDVIGVDTFESVLFRGTDPKRALVDFSTALEASYKAGRALVLDRERKEILKGVK